MSLPKPLAPANYSQADDCAICYEKLLIPTSNDSSAPSYVIDDIQLPCKHHLHWSCFEDYDRASPDNRSQCPICRINTLNDNGQLVVDIMNEGGFTGAFDLGQELDLQRWHEDQPEEWKIGQILLGLCESEEFEDAEEMLRDKHADPNAAYPDGNTGLHLAACSNNVQWASLLLKYGANKDLKNEEGETALDCAESEDAQDVVRLLTSP